MVEQRALLFEDQADGAVLVRDASSHAVVDTIQPGAFGFVRVAMRGMGARQAAHGVGADRQFPLTRWRDGRVTLDDPGTGEDSTCPLSDGRTGGVRTPPRNKRGGEQ